MNFTILDIALLVIFAISVSIFLFLHKKNLKKDGLMILYRTKLGMKLIDSFGKKHKTLLTVLSYISIITGFILMGLMIYFFGKLVWTYIFQSQVVKLMKIPPIMPLIPYLPQMFKLSFLPPFYFTYWILILAIVAISHEFSHGIFMRRYNIKIKSTGFGFFPFFLPVFLAAFVEQDEKNMEKKKIFPQMAVLSAGTFANVIIGILFAIILILFFTFSFSPAGVVFDSYTYSIISSSTIISINNSTVENLDYSNFLDSINEKGLTEVKTENGSFLITKSFLESQKENENYFYLYNNAPAIKENLSNTIIKINGNSVKSKTELANELSKYSPEDKIIITTLEDDAYVDYEIVLDRYPENESLPYLGIGFLTSESSGILGTLKNLFLSFKDSNVYYESNFEAAEFIYNLLWWLVLISFSVALINMLPVGIFDGGRFFYLAILGITKSENKAKKAYSLMTYIFLALLAVIMVFWAINLWK